jgi:hypothetical protein
MPAARPRDLLPKRGPTRALAVPLGRRYYDLLATIAARRGVPVHLLARDLLRCVVDRGMSGALLDRAEVVSDQAVPRGET